MVVDRRTNPTHHNNDDVAANNYDDTPRNHDN
jgi:hypothetical protein